MQGPHLFTSIVQTLGKEPHTAGNCYTPETFPALKLCHSAGVALKQQGAPQPVIKASKTEALAS